MASISAIVATYRRRDELVRLLNSMVANQVDELQVIIVDQNQDGLIDDIIREYEVRLDILHLKMKEANQSKARNFGAGKAKYPIICFPDDDCWFDADALKKTQQFFDKDNSTDLLIINWKQNPIEHANSFTLTKKELFTFRSVGYVTYVLFFNKGIFAKLGGFIETIGIGKYIGGGEDSELTFRAAHLNLRIFYSADIIVNHKYISVLSRDLDTIRSRQRAMGLMYAKYQVPKLVVFKGLTAPLLKMAFCMSKRKAQEYYNMFLGRKEGYIYGLKNKGALSL